MPLQAYGRITDLMKQRMAFAVLATMLLPGFGIPCASAMSTDLWVPILFSALQGDVDDDDVDNDPDDDADGIKDSLELELAKKFAPDLHIDDDSWTVLYGADYSYRGSPCPIEDPYCKLPFVVREYRNDGTDLTLDCSEPMQCLEIHYAMIYNWDFGKGVCDAAGGWVPLFGGVIDFVCDNSLISYLSLYGFYENGHRGDSEHIAVLIARKSPSPIFADWSTPWEESDDSTEVNSWRIVGRMTSAHRCADGFDSSAITDLVKRNADSNAPLSANQHDANPQVVYIAEDKNASYLSDAACDMGALHVDDCDGGNHRRAFPTYALKNAGEFGAPLSDPYINYPGTCSDCEAGTEGLTYIWDDAPEVGNPEPIFKIWRNMGPGHTEWDTEWYYCD